MQELRYLSPKEAHVRHDELVRRFGRVPGTLYGGALGFILDHVRQHGRDVSDKAAFLLHVIAIQHPFCAALREPTRY